jgi:hypothetical protein
MIPWADQVASGSGLAFNVGRFATADGVFAAGGLFSALAARGKSHPWPFSTWATPQKAEVFGGRQSPHPSATGFFHSLLGGSYASVGTACGLLYALGLLVIWLVPADGRSPQAA